MGDLSTFEFFQRESCHEDVEIRQEAYEQISLICGLIGADQCREVMINYLIERVKIDIDQIHVIIARKLRAIIEASGGGDYAHLFIPIIEFLAQSEETVVRDAIAQSLEEIVSKTVTSSHRESVTALIEMTNRLINETNEEVGDIFYPRYTAAKFCPSILKVAQNNSTIIDGYISLCNHEIILVRQAAISVISTMASYAGERNLDICSALIAATSDEMENIQVFAISKIAQVAKVIGKSATTAQLLPVVVNNSQVASWKVKLSVAKILSEFVFLIPEVEVSSQILTVVENLLQDRDSEVRTHAVITLRHLTSLVPSDKLSRVIIPLAPLLIEDFTVSVRKETVAAIVAMLTNVESSNNDKQLLYDLIIKVVNDEDSAVRVSLVNSLPIIAERAPELLKELMTTIKSLFSDQFWRIRVSLAEAMPAIYMHMGSDFFRSNFLEEYKSLLKDSVSNVRVGSAASIFALLTATGSDFIQESLFPYVKALASDEQLFRITSVMAAKAILSGDDINDNLQQEALQILLDASSDSVPNVRLTAAIALGEVVTKLNDSSRPRVRAMLSELQTDKDKDVVFYATQSYQICS